MTELSDKVLLEPYVWKRTRTVLKRVRTSNRPILSNPTKHKKTNDNPISRKYRKKNNSFEKKKYTNLKKIPLNIQNKHKKIKKRNQYPL